MESDRPDVVQYLEHQSTCRDRRARRLGPSRGRGIETTRTAQNPAILGAPAGCSVAEISLPGGKLTAALDRCSIIDLDSVNGATVPLGAVWSMLVAGHCRIVDSFCTDHRCYAVLRHGPPPRRARRCLVPRNVELVERILLGDSQKLVALDLGLAPSTVALIVQRCLRALGLDCHASSVPVLLVMAVHGHKGAEALNDGRRVDIEHDGARCMVISAPRPDARLQEMLSGCECAVARLRVEGRSHAEIARLRRVSPRTVANQLTATFQKLRVSGRADLLRELICSYGRPGLAAPSANGCSALAS